MGLFDFIRGQFIDVIEWVDASRDTIIWKFPDQDKEVKPGLMSGFRPIIDSTIKTEGADKEWSSITNVYNKIPFINKPLENNLSDFISARVIDLMFVMVANEEEQIRNKYELRKTDMMKKVFTWAEKEVQKKIQNKSN